MSDEGEKKSDDFVDEMMAAMRTTSPRPEGGWQGAWTNAAVPAAGGGGVNTTTVRTFGGAGGGTGGANSTPSTVKPWFTAQMKFGHSPMNYFSQAMAYPTLPRLYYDDGPSMNLHQKTAPVSPVNPEPTLADYADALARIELKLSPMPMRLEAGWLDGSPFYTRPRPKISIYASVSSHDHDGANVSLQFYCSIARLVSVADYVKVAVAFVRAVWLHELDEALHFEGRRIREPHPIVCGTRQSSTTWDWSTLPDHLKLLVR